ncbi:hypothetical protein EXE46_04915 [Halorubrum sp. GN11_10-6_MGM]|uniref:DUF7563 family protein n=1 Tax=Halorubrum sp. GN11_10-6_MGM TaxID=2518112 RepID=UPI0010F9E0EE|nr:hypothetical protein [Halorubrum sp. GN11_10-6_MGM]TKX75208.1 hypothetical protein EXE46_04915 [Halorubrum sp. GN11_10-6_MGM]
MALRIDAADPGVCRGCGAHVPSDFRRVHGDEDQLAYRCPGCDSWVRICEGSAAGKDVKRGERF